MMRVVQTTCLVALALVACGKRQETAPILPKPAIAQTHGCQLRGEVVPGVPRFSLGEQGYVTFRVTTDCAEPLKVLIVADAGNEKQRPNSYRVGAIDAKGAEVR